MALFGDAIDATAVVDLLWLDVSPSFFFSAPAMAPRTVCGCQSRAFTIFVDGGAFRPARRDCPADRCVIILCRLASLYHCAIIKK
jgi:hypothetical protein